MDAPSGTFKAHSSTKEHFMRTRKLNAERVRRLCAKDQGSRALFRYLGQLKGTQANATSVEELLAGVLATQKTVISRRSLVRLLYALANAGCGSFRIGRRSKPSRFEWAAPAHSIASMILGETQAAPEPVSTKNRLTQSTSSTPGPAASSGNELIHSYHLRRELTISIRLPADITEREAHRLADFIRTLWFGPA
jgi:hypothetical protein